MTLKDIAERANVSISTVSRCLNESPLVSAETRQRVLKIARESGFEFNASARGLSTSQVGTIGVILPEDYERFDSHLYHASFHNHLRRTLEREDLDLMVAFPDNRFSGVNNIEKLVRRKKVDGLILVTPRISPETKAFLAEQRIPYVHTHYPPVADQDDDIDWVYVDNERGGMLVGEFFARRGCHRVVTFYREKKPEYLEFEQRVRGVKAGLMLGEYRGSIDELPGDSSFESGLAIASSPDDLLREADAVFALNDLMAFGIIQGLASRGRRVPQDIRVVGYDDTPLAGTFAPRLTTVRQPAEEVAYLTCERLVKLIEDRVAGREHVPKRIALQPHLIIRDSAR